MKTPTPTKPKSTVSDNKKIDTSLSSKEQEVLINSKAVKPAISTSKPPKDTLEPKKSDTANTGHRYHYTLVTSEQKKVIDLLKVKNELEKLFKSFFSNRLLSIEIEEHSYTISLTDEFKVGEKRMLGRQVGLIDDMKRHAKKVFYNNGQDFSTQLFKLKKEK